MIKLKKQNILEIGKPIPESFDIELCGCQKLRTCNIDIFEEYAKNEKLTRFETEFKKEQKFFYNISQYSNNKVIKFEVGVGHVANTNKKCVLKRERAFYYSTDGQNVFPDNSGFLGFNCYNDEFLLISQHTPISYLELLYEPHSVIVSEDNFLPSSVDIKKHSVLGRRGGLIESIKIEDLLSNLIRYNEQEECIEFNNGKGWIKLQEKINEDTK
jgi:hypothetical protein